MFQQPWYVMILPSLPILLAHLAGVVVAIVLLVRRRSAAAILALIGFGLLFIMDLADFGRGPLVGLLTGRMGINQFWAVSATIGCCCSIFDVAAVVCLIVAIWQAVSAITGEEAEGMEEMVGEFVELSDQMAEEGE